MHAQDLQGLTSRQELDELLSAAKARLPELLRSDPAAPPLGFFFDPVPAAGEEGGEGGVGVGEKRKRVMIDDYEMEGGEGGDVNVMRMVRPCSERGPQSDAITRLSALHASLLCTHHTSPACLMATAGRNLLHSNLLRPACKL